MAIAALYHEAMVNWRDIQDKAVAFIHEYGGAKDEDREAKAFWVRFFDIFGVRERSLGIFEKRVEMLGDRAGKIDFFAPNKFLVEHKSKGKDLNAAFKQASDYFDALSEEDKPRFIIVSDFDRFRIYDLESGGNEDSEFEFSLKDLPKHVQHFAFLTDEDVQEYKDEAPINIKAVKAIGKLHDALRSSNYPPDALSPLLTRLVFCFFADDTEIFNKNSLRRYLEESTKKDGSDIGAHLGIIFQILDTPEDARQTTTHEVLAALPFVNGGLFAEPLPAVFGSRDIRDTLMACVTFNWSAISPAIFGSMFQSVLDEKERHDLGAHYTSEENILKVINGLFLEELNDELDAANTNHDKLNALWQKVSGITLLDPACGCGNFLVIAYRELRKIELEIIKRFYPHAKKVDAGHMVLPMNMTKENLKKLSKLSVERMFGIELEAFPAEVAKLSLWLMDHMMNVELGAYFGKPLRKLPLTEQPHISVGNALQMNWENVVPKNKLTYILGNPPFLGARVMSAEQKKDIEGLFGKMRGVGNLDYVTGWYFKASEYMQGTNITCAFVSTNSITQGEQVGILWKFLIEDIGAHIHFAHRTFRWSNEASGKAAVFCVIVCFGLFPHKRPKIYEYANINGEPKEVVAKHINPYLVDAPDVFVLSRTKPLSKVPSIGVGNLPIDGGMYLFTTEERDEFLKKEPGAIKYFRRWIGSDEFLNGWERWCLWVGNANPNEIRDMPEVLRRVEAVRESRLLSKRPATRKLADTPTRFHLENMPEKEYLVVPKVSSERRSYIPIGFEQPTTLASDLVFIVPDATLYHFGILESEMHMTWMRAVAGRLKSDYRYSNTLVYNTFPWPEKPTDEHRKAVEDAAQVVLDARKQFPDATLADLYNKSTMPKVLLDAHHALDRAVDRCYGKRSFKSEPDRLEFLFERYQELCGNKS